MSATGVTVAAIQMAALRLVVKRKIADRVDIEQRAREPEAGSALEWSRRYGLFRTADNRILEFRKAERPYQTRLLTDNSKRIIVAKSRQIGVSNTIAFRCAYEASVKNGTVLIVSKSLEQAVQFLRYVYIALNNSPHPNYLRRSLTTLEFVTGGSIIAQASTDKAGRGTAASLAVLDEYAWQEYARQTMTGITPSLATTNGTLILLSTPNGMGEPFQETWEIANQQVRDEAETGKKAEWSIHFLPWSVNTDWDEAWAERTRSEMGVREFAQEHEVDFLLSGLNVFNAAEIENLWKLPNEYVDQSTGNFIMPVERGHKYVSAFDVGRKQDPFVGFTYDVTHNPYRVVAYERFTQMSYPDQASTIEKRYHHFLGHIPNPAFGSDPLESPYIANPYGWTDYDKPTHKLSVESNGVGDPLIQFLTVPVDEFTTTALTKKNAIDALSLLLQRGELIAPLIPQWKRELTVYLREDEKLVQDTVMSSAICALIAGRPIVIRAQSFTPSVFYSG